MALVPGQERGALSRDEQLTTALRRYTASGTADTSFESSPGVGVARTGLPESDNGNLIAAPGGRWIVWSELGMMRFKADGTRDHAFGTLLSGNVIAPFFTGAAITSAGDILASYVHTSVLQHEAAVGIRKIEGSGLGPPMVGVVGSTLWVTRTGRQRRDLGLYDRSHRKLRCKSAANGNTSSTAPALRGFPSRRAGRNDG